MSNKFSTFKSVKDTISTLPATAIELIDCIQKDTYKELCDAIRSAPDKDTRSALKAKLPAVTVSGVFSKRSASCLITHSGLIMKTTALCIDKQCIVLS